MIRSALLFIFLCLAIVSRAQNYRFSRLGYQDGLSDNTVSCIYKSSKGFVWIGTQLGLNRYDGIRVRSYYSVPNDVNSLPDNDIRSITEDAEGRLWLSTPSGICIFDPSTESVERNVQKRLKNKDIDGNLTLVASDKDKNLWLVTKGHDIWYYNFKTGKASMILGKSKLPQGNITGMTVYGTVAIIAYDNGLVAGVGREHKDLMWVADYITKNRKNAQPLVYKPFVDSHHNIWVTSGDIPYVFINATHKWTSIQNYLVYDVAEDKQHNILLATDHQGIVALNGQFQNVFTLTNILFDDNSIPDNTVTSLFVDKAGIVWTGTLRMGAAYYYSGRFMASTLPLGDVTSMSRYRNGLLWLGTNYDGVKCYNMFTGQTVSFGKGRTGLGSDIISCVLATRDGSVWVGAFRGGLARFHNGQWTSWKPKPGGLAGSSVWALQELPDGRIAIGTLQNGLQIFNPWTGRFITFNTDNSSISTNTVYSLSFDRKRNRLYIGNTYAFSVLDMKTMKIANFNQSDAKEGEYFISNNCNQILVDSRGLVWLATAGGLSAYDPKTRHIENIRLSTNHARADVKAIIEDKKGHIWATTVNSVHSVTVKKLKNGWDFMVNYYGKSDGINNRLFNKRSIFCSEDGCMLFGGIDGVNLIDPRKFFKKSVEPHVVFSDLAVFGSLVRVGQNFDGDVILKRAINDTHEVSLNHHQNTITIYLATDAAGQYDRPRFMYSMEGTNKWFITSESEPSVTLNDLSYGKHTLLVRIVDRAGNPLTDISSLTIKIRQPFYLSVWAMIIYSLILLVCLWVAYKYKERQRAAKKSQEDLDKEKEVDDVKMQFFTNTSNELRTPLTLILTPLHTIMDEETNPSIYNKLRIIEKNAEMLMNMINQMLDLRRLITNKEKLNLLSGNIVPVVRKSCQYIYDSCDKHMSLVFRSEADSIIMDFDSEKLTNMIHTLVYDSYKFTPENGEINVDITIGKDSKEVYISVIDNGVGIPEEDKPHIFERFYMKNDIKLGAIEGAGLNIVWEYAKMMGGSVSAEDNPGGGTIFTITLPILRGIVSGQPVYVKLERDKSKDVVPVEAASLNTGSVVGGKGKIILLVSDNADNLNLLSLELVSNYTILTARNGREALYMIDMKKPDLIITDSLMPKMNGLELCRALKEKDETKDIPVVLLSVRMPDKTNEDLIKMGFTAFIAKPFNMNDLKRRIKDILKLKAQEEQ